MSDPTTATELRDALFTAILSEDDNALRALCNGYADAVVEHFREWTTVPPEFRANQNAMNAWAHCLIGLATIFEAHGVPDLMQWLTGGADNVIVRWHNSFAHATERAHAGDYEASNQLLHDLLAQLEGAQGDVVDDYRPKVCGLLGTNAFRLGQYVEAVNFTTRALNECKRIGDGAGVRAYTENLRTLSVAAAAEATDAARSVCVAFARPSLALRTSVTKAASTSAMRSSRRGSPISTRPATDSAASTEARRLACWD